MISFEFKLLKCFSSNDETILRNTWKRHESCSEINTKSIIAIASNCRGISKDCTLRNSCSQFKAINVFFVLFILKPKRLMVGTPISNFHYTNLSGFSYLINNSQLGIFVDAINTCGALIARNDPDDFDIISCFNTKRVFTKLPCHSSKTLLRFNTANNQCLTNVTVVHGQTRG